VNGCGKSALLAVLGNREVPIQDHIDIYYLGRDKCGISFDFLPRLKFTIFLIVLRFESASFCDEDQTISTLITSGVDREVPASEKTALMAVMEADEERVKLEKLAEDLATREDEESQEYLMQVCSPLFHCTLEYFD
jgi:ATP-binding cassette subfamily F protein 2